MNEANDKVLALNVRLKSNDSSRLNGQLQRVLLSLPAAERNANHKGI